MFWFLLTVWSVFEPYHKKPMDGSVTLVGQYSYALMLIQYGLSLISLAKLQWVEDVETTKLDGWHPYTGVQAANLLLMNSHSPYKSLKHAQWLSSALFPVQNLDYSVQQDCPPSDLMCFEEVRRL